MRVRRLAWLVPAALFFLNPALACGDGDPQVMMFHFGAAELRAAVEGTWTVTLKPTAGSTQQLTLGIDQSSEAPSNAMPPCGGRTLVKPAGACVPVSTMPLQVTLISGDEAFAGAALSGTFAVTGWEFAEGQVTLLLGANRVDFRLTPGGGPTNVRGTGTGGTVTLVRQPPG